MKSDPTLTLVTAANHAYWRCAYQFLRSAERRNLQRRHRVIAYDLGINPKTLNILRSRFGWCEWRHFEFEAYPAHVAVDRKTYAWKPIIVADLVAELANPVLWLDSATLFPSDIDGIAEAILRSGTFALKGQCNVVERCDPITLAALSAPSEILHLPERVACVIGLDGRHPAIQELAEQWRRHALVEGTIKPRPQTIRRHMNDQALLTVLLYKMQLAGKLTLGDDEIDISSPWPTPWITSRNKVPPWLPRWADPFARAYYWSYKTADRYALRLKRRRSERSDGPLRLFK